jgi:Domain of unknown function (DUF5348)
VIEGKLVHSSNTGRYALDDPQAGREIINGQTCEIFLNGGWIQGSVEHSGNLYAIEGTTQHAFSGYYFIASNGGICGLCTNMKVRIAE